MKLTIELVPETSWYTNVRSEVSKDVWTAIKQKTRARAGDRCEICGGVGPKWPVECHEVWAYDDIEHVQKLVGFIALCPDCHQVKHIGFATTQGKLEEAIEHFKRVNELDSAREYLIEVWNKWEERNLYKWKLDLRFIKEYLSE